MPFIGAGCRTGLGVGIGLALVVAFGRLPSEAQSGCDPNYGVTPNGCVPLGGDLDCPDLWERGIGDIAVVGSDWMRLDGYQDFQSGEWVVLPDGLGCEWVDSPSGQAAPGGTDEVESDPAPSTSSEFEPGPELAPDPLESAGDRCLAAGDLVCAKESFEAAYAASMDEKSKSDLYEFYLLNGDNWQQHLNLEMARNAYTDSVRLDPTKPEAIGRLEHLGDYVDVEFFDAFETFGDPRLNESTDGGATVHLIADGVLEMTSTVPEWSTFWFLPHTPSSTNYAIAADVSSLGPSSAVGLIVARGPASESFHFVVDPALQEWWIAYRNLDGSWTPQVLPVSYPSVIQGPIQRLEVRVRNGVPAFLVNGVDLTAPLDLAWMQIPRTGDSGVFVENSPSSPTAPIAATFDSFGIYELPAE